MPLFHIHGLIAGLLAPLASGGSVALAPDFDAFRFFDWLGELRPSWYTAVPTMHQLILDRAARHPETVAAANLRFARSSSSSLPPSVLEAIEATFRAPMVEAYGMTEASHQMVVPAAAARGPQAWLGRARDRRRRHDPGRRGQRARARRHRRGGDPR